MNNVADTNAIVIDVFDKIAAGFTTTRACRDANISYVWFKKVVERTPELKELYEEALQCHYDTLAETLVEIDTSPLGSSDPRMAGVLSKNIQWLLARRRQREYGDRMEVTHTVTADKAIIDALNLAKERHRTLAIPKSETPVVDLIIDETGVAVEDDWMAEFV